MGRKKFGVSIGHFSCSILVLLKVEPFTLYTFDSSANHSKHLKIKRIDHVSFGITFAAPLA
jgi:hypothetical protein